MFALMCVLVFVLAFGAGVASKLLIKPSWAAEYSASPEDVGAVHRDIAYGEGEAHRFDLYLPVDGSRDSYGLVVYIHAGGFTSGDKADDAAMLSWLCSKGYVAAGINYTLRTADNDKSVYSQSLEIREAMPKVVEEAQRHGYNIDGMAVAGGSAGGTLAMLYAWRDAQYAPVPVKLMFEAVGPASFYRADWGPYGLDRDTDESRASAAALFGVMLGTEIPVEALDTPEYDGIIKPISAFMWVDEQSAPCVIAYGAHDRVCPFKSAAHLVSALEQSGVDYRYFELPHSGHGLQNDDAIYRQYMEAVEEYLDRYLPVDR